MKGLVFIFIALFGFAFADDCTDSMRAFVGSSDAIVARTTSTLKYDNAIDAVHPTQSIFGTAKIVYLRSKLDKMSFDEVQAYLDERPIPYVLGPDGKLWIVDRHHTFRTFYETKEVSKKKRLKFTFERRADKSDMSWDDFYRWMQEQKYMFLKSKDYSYISPRELPGHIKDLKVDYFRGLAWLMVKSGVIMKSPVEFSEFFWADYFSRNLKRKRKYEKDEIKKAIKLILKEEEEIKSFPGYVKASEDKDFYWDNLDKYWDVIKDEQ